ncbi:MAG: hypothetical protein GXZ04_07885 [Clostridiales bacterium]|nr:hypothetical protein [Clostridiales bacterium]
MQTGNNRRRSRRSRKSRLSLRQARRGGARQVHLARVLSFAGAALALLAVVLLISYLVQGHNTRQEQARQRELYRAN